MVGKHGKSELGAWRESWGAHANTALEKAGSEARVDHRSLKDRGIDQIAQPKIGVAATAMKRRGVVADPERCQLVRYVKSLNFARPWMKAIEKSGEVAQHGMGTTWWERSLLFMAQARQMGRNTVMDAWTRLMHSRQPGGRDIPPHDRGPDLSR